MKRAAKMATILALAAALTANGTVLTSLATETGTGSELTQDVLTIAETGQGSEKGGSGNEETTVIQPRTEEEGGESGGSSGDPGTTEGGSSGDTGNTEGGSSGGDTGSTEGGNTGGNTGNTESGDTGGDTDTGSTEGSGSIGSDTGSTEGGAGEDTGSTEGGGADTGSTEKDPETETDKKPGKETEKVTEKETEKKPDKETETETNKKPGKETEKETEKITEKETEKESQKETEQTQQSTQAPVIVTKPNVQTEAAVQTEEEELQDPEEEPLYSEYLGTGVGWDQLKIVSDENNRAVDYELLLIQDAVIICTQSDPIVIQDETQPDESRSLTLSWAQLARLMEEKAAAYLVFEMDQAMVTAEFSELLTGNMTKLIAMALSGEIPAEELLHQDFDTAEERVLSEEQLASVFFEMRMVPCMSEEGDSIYDITIWMLWGDQELEISGMLPALKVALDVEGLFTEEEKTDFAMNHAVEWTEESGRIIWKASALVDMPEALIGTDKSLVGRYMVELAESTEVPYVEYTEEDMLRTHSHSVLMASYAGPGTYGIS